MTLPSRAKERYLWFGMLFALIALAVARDVSLPFLFSPIVLLVGLSIIWIVLDARGLREGVIASAFVFIFSLMLLFRESIPTQKLRKLGIAPDERAVLFLRENFKEGTRVAAYAPNIPLAANMKYVPLNKGEVSEFRSEHDLQRWMIDTDLEAIYVDDDLTQLESSLWRVIESQIGQTLNDTFSSDKQEVRILRIRTPGKMTGPEPRHSVEAEFVD